MSRLLKYLALLTVLFMPLGMATAAAPAHQSVASMPMEHCPDRAPTHDMKGGLAACTMACSAALPAADLSQSEPLALAYAPVAPGPIASLRGIQPDTATPPPKRS